jgi:hypothetical protein
MQRKRKQAVLSHDIEPRLRPVIEALEAQELALSELTDLTEKQAETIGGIVLVLRALMDVVLDEEQRALLQSHLTMTTAGHHRRAKRSVIGALLD